MIAELGKHATTVNTAEDVREIYHEGPGLVTRGGGEEARDCMSERLLHNHLLRLRQADFVGNDSRLVNKLRE